MRRFFATIGVLLVCGLPYALAQSADSSGADPRDFSAAENLRAARARGPATWVQQARERHNGLISDRLTASRLGTRDTSADPSVGGQGTGGAGTGSSGTGGLDLGGLLDLANQFGGIGNLGGLADSLPGLEGMLDSFTGGTGANASAAPGVPDGAQADLRSQVRDDATTGGAIGRLPDKATDLREQAVNDEEPKFMLRLADSLLQTFFTAITVAFQTQPFIDSLKDLLRPILAPPEPPADDGANGDGTGNTPGNQGNLDDLDADDPDDSSPPGGGSSIVLHEIVGPLDRLALV